MGGKREIGDVLPEPSLREWALWLLRRRRRLRVTGDSMLPTLQAGDLVLVDPAAYRECMPRAGEIVVAWHPFRRDLPIIKRVASLTPEGRCVLHSDNPRAGSDSRQFGAIAVPQIVGRVTCRIPAA